MKNIIDKQKFQIGIRKSFTPPRLVLLGFMAIIFLGAFFLSLPISNTNGQWLNFVDSLFMATSATCVTGLSTVVVASNFTFFGQFILLILIQVGGLGVMTISSALYILFSNRSTLSQRLSLSSEYSDFAWHDFSRMMKKLFIVVISIEAFGAILLSIGFAITKQFSAGQIIWYGIFHSVSAFCNAGLDVISTAGTSMMAFNSEPLIVLTLAFLIISGGIGFIVIIDIIQKHSWRKFQLQSKIVIPMTVTLLLLGTAIFMGVEWNNPATLGSMSVGDKIMNAFFHSTTTRTAGFATLDCAKMNNASIPVTIILMFVGASPGSTGGGLKTTTMFVLLASVLSTIRQKKGVIVDMHKIGKVAIKRATTILMLSLLIQGISFLALILAQSGTNLSNESLLYEITSAFATVGLSMGATSKLTILGKFIIILNMFLGRVGILTFFMAFKNKDNINNEDKIKYPEANISI